MSSIRKVKKMEKKQTLRDLRISNEKTAAEVATVLGVAISSYYNYEHGVREINIRQVLALSKYYDCSAEELIEAQISSRPFSLSDNQQ